jgi:hypothetical protein
LIPASPVSSVGSSPLAKPLFIFWLSIQNSTSGGII